MNHQASQHNHLSFVSTVILSNFTVRRIFWNAGQLMDNDHLKVMDKEGYVEVPGAEVLKSSIRKSSRLQSKKNLSSCSKYVFKSSRRNSKHTLKSSEAGQYKDNLFSESKIQEDKKRQFLHRNEANVSSMKSSTVVPSFQYHVQSKDGIPLVVDLNLKRSDWLKSLEKTVCVCQNHSKPAFESFRKEVECLGNRNNIKVSSSDKTSASDGSMNSCIQNKCSLESTSMEDVETLPKVKEKEVIAVSDFKQCWSKVDHNSEVVLESSGHSEEVQLSDFSSAQKGSLCSSTGKICSESLLNSTTEVNQEAGGNHGWSTAINEERINSAEGMEVSGREDNAVVISASDDGSKRKKRDYKSDLIHGQPHERILRSTEVLGGKILERDGVVIWRSSRLHSK
ncbi:hypothetical protein QVD17_13209 [Tagetes erecta]|uniref:Uncharacterized protein n=1 Tax=Tagetes erecta TaxID=13708 RepID=A0AAD8L0B7_TARER|nr:hypothetical protein QVD17_13209 [Tagetes erecta]